jgi:hypothetical protein
MSWLEWIGLSAAVFAVFVFWGVIFRERRDGGDAR